VQFCSLVAISTSQTATGKLFCLECNVFIESSKLCNLICYLIILFGHEICHLSLFVSYLARQLLEALRSNPNTVICIFIYYYCQIYVMSKHKSFVILSQFTQKMLIIINEIIIYLPSLLKYALKSCAPSLVYSLSVFRLPQVLLMQSYHVTALTKLGQFEALNATAKVEILKSWVNPVTGRAAAISNQRLQQLAEKLQPVTVSARRANGRFMCTSP
jgi:hypothetical protein